MLVWEEHLQLPADNALLSGILHLGLREWVKCVSHSGRWWYLFFFYVVHGLSLYFPLVTALTEHFEV